jgi:hypothetical protein
MLKIPLGSFEQITQITKLPLQTVEELANSIT